jgi:hypothetical protein
LIYFTLVLTLPLLEYARSLQSTKYNNVNLATLSDPDRNSNISPLLTLPLLPTVETRTSASALNLLTGLYRFTLSDCGSIAPLPTLKPNVTTSAPRLSTGGWLNLTRQDFHLLYI